MSQTAAASVEEAVAAFRDGSPLLVHDAADREGETDLIYPAEAVTPTAVSRLRNDAGGLVCTALSHDVAERFGLDYMDEIIDHPASEGHDLGYDSRSSFSLTVNHRDTYTGITDDDRSLTIRKLAHAAASPTKPTSRASSARRVTFTCSKRHPDCWPSDRATPNSVSSSRRRRTGPPPSSSVKCWTTKPAVRFRRRTHAPTPSVTNSRISKGRR